MDKYEETFKTWNSIAQIYEDKFMDLDIYNTSYDHFLKHLPNNSKLLEIGCGPGNITRYFLTKNSTLNIKGVDVSENMIKLAQMNNPLASFEVMDVRYLDQETASYNAIVCGFCIPYLSAQNCEQLIMDCFNILEDNGLLYLSFVPGEPENSGFISGSNGDRAYFYYHEIDCMNKKLSDKGFSIIDSIQINYEKSDAEIEKHLIIIAKKQ